jgi:choline dehydrogenase-like flavoprotein
MSVNPILDGIIMMKTHYDIAVIGSGPGGATVARELAEKGKKVVIFEWGSNAQVQGSFSQFLMNASLPGKSVLFTNKKLLAMFRGICTGGSSIFYCATAFEPPYEMLNSYGISIENEIKTLKKEIPVAPLSDDLIGPAAKRIMESATELGYNWEKINKFIYQDKCRLGCAKCSYGCPYDAKWTARNFVEQATDKGARLISHAKVDRVIMESGRAVGVEYTKRFRTFKVFADKIIVAAGGIGSPLILRRTGLDRAGYGFFFDPLITVFGTVESLYSEGEPQMAAGIHVEEEGYVMTDLSFTAPLIAVQSLAKLKPHRAFLKSKMLMLMVKIKDDLGGRITRGGGVRKSLSYNDKQKLKSGFNRARHILKNAGATQIYSGGVVAAHPGGTVKIGDLVDSDLKTVYDNLYVCDCSVIPEAWGLPPTLTLLGLGKRLAGHLSD